MDVEQAKAVVSRFNEFINARDIAGLSEAMTDDHVFIDAANSRVSGKQACLRAWRGFFSAFPDYRNDLAQFAVDHDLLVIVGRSSCSDPRLAGPALWTVKVQGGESSRTAHATGPLSACTGDRHTRRVAAGSGEGRRSS
jgi:ketosteroid isomerase-like protein